MPDGLYPTLEEFMEELRDAHAGHEITLHEFIHREYRPREKDFSLPVKRPSPGGSVFKIWDPFYGRWRIFGYHVKTEAS